MSTINHHTHEVNFKVVYYGPGLSGKTTCLQHIHRSLPASTRGPLIMLPTEQDRTIYFDFLPLKLPALAGYTTRIHLYTVPGQVHYNSTRQLVLSGADGVVFVADSQPGRLEANIESLRDLRENLRERHPAAEKVPLVMLLNKRDLAEALPRQALEQKLNEASVPCFETVATRGIGVLESLRAIVRVVLQAHRAAVFRQHGQGRAEAARRRTGPLPQTESSPRAASQVEGEGEEPGSITISSLSAISGAVDRFVGASSTRDASARKTPRSLSVLIGTAAAAGAVAALEGRIAEGDWAGAVRLAAEACAELPLLFSCAPGSRENAVAMAAFVAGAPPERFFRFQEAATRTTGNGAVTAVDAVFALFFYCDLAMRLEERRFAEQRVRLADQRAAQDEEQR